MNIYEKLLEVRKSCPFLKKDTKGYQYKYVSSSQTLTALREAMDKHALLLIPKVIGTRIQQKESTNDKGKVVLQYFTELDMEYTWINTENPDESICITWYGQGIDTGEKGVGKALTYAEKYFLLKFFQIATDKDDPDADQGKNDSDKPQSKQKQQQAPKIDKGKADLLELMNECGRKYYGKIWNKRKADMVTHITHGIDDREEALSVKEIQSIIDGIDYRNAHPITDKQLKYLHKLGTDVYKDKWNKERSGLIEQATGGRVTSSKAMSEEEAKSLIETLEKQAVVDGDANNGEYPF